MSDHTRPHENPQRGLIAQLITSSARAPLFTLFVTLMLGVGGAVALQNTPLDALPDLSDTQVIVLTEWSGQSPDLVEDHLTYPLSSALMSAPKVSSVRGQSFFGLSFVSVIFEEGVDLYWARSRVLEQLSTLQGELPPEARPELGPDATGVGWVLMYALADESGGRDLAELRALQDWNIRYALESVPGVAEVAPLGGYERQYQVQLNPELMQAHKVTLAQVREALKASNQDVGGRTLELAGHEYMIRGRGYLKGREDIEVTPLKVSERGAPLLLRDVAEVTLGPAPRRGVAEWNGRGEVVGGVVVMRQGESALAVIERVKERLEALKASLPEGVKVELAYDRSELINASINTLTHTLIEELAVVSLIILLFLLSVRSALVPVLTLPVAVLFAFLPMWWQGISANIMSLGGIAVALGAMVDASLILIENVHKRLEEEPQGATRRQVIIEAMCEVGPSIFFSLLVITVSFLPIFTLQGVEGRLFKPLAYTKTYAMGFAALLAVTLTPALVSLLVKGEVRAEAQHPLSRLLTWLYVPVVRAVVRHRWLVVALALLAMLFTLPAAWRLKSEFMPPLNEGSLLYMPSAPPGMSMTEATSVVQAMDKQLMEVPEVLSVLGKMGRAETATDPAPLGMAETTITLKPREQWREGLTWEGLVEELDSKLTYPGMPNLWWMPIQTRTEMLATGVRSPLALQLFGEDLATLERAAVSLERALKELPATRSAFAERATGGFYLDLHIKREEAARYGLRVREVQEAIQTAIGGVDVTEVIEGRRRFALNVRYARELRDDPSLFERVLIDTPRGAPVPLTQVAEMCFVSGPPMIRSEGAQLTSFVFVDPGQAPIGEYVRDAQALIEASVRLPQGVRLEWAGQHRYLKRAEARLALVIPLTLALVLLLLYLNTRSFTESLIVLTAVPFSLIGAVWLLYLLDFHMSVAVWVGLIALAGLDAETGVVMLLYLRLAEGRARREGRLNTSEELTEAIVEGAAGRVRPKLMTVLTTMIGLTPLLWSSGVGADMMKRLAAPMVGGLASSFLLELTVYPALFAIWRRRALPQITHSITHSPPLTPPQPGGKGDTP